VSRCPIYLLSSMRAVMVNAVGLSGSAIRAAVTHCPAMQTAVAILLASLVFPASASAAATCTSACACMRGLVMELAASWACLARATAC
jgi:hypothetical protein